MPQVAFRLEGEPRFGLHTELAGELVYFDRDDSVTGPGGADLQPRVSLPLSGDAWFLRPTFAHRFTYYRPEQHRRRERSRHQPETSPTFAVDAGLFFDRTRDASGAVQTLEPRLYYLKVPYEDQSDIPLFDTAAFDFGISQLYRENRFSGSDRIADAEQLSLGLTTRFIDGADGRERLRASIGQILYFEDRLVTLAGGAGDAPPATATPVAGSGRRDVSDFVGEVSAGLGRDWFGRANLQWKPRRRRHGARLAARDLAPAGRAPRQPRPPRRQQPAAVPRPSSWTCPRCGRSATRGAWPGAGTIRSTRTSA